MDDDPHRVLARNAACHQCRRRKLKCDAVRPTCGNCRKPRQRGPIKYEPPEPCTWDEQRGPSARTLRKREAKQRRAAQDAAGMAGPPPDWSMNNNGQHGNLHAARVEAEMYMPGASSMHPTGNGMSHTMPLSAGAIPPYSMSHAGPSSATMAGVDWGAAPPPPPMASGSVRTEGFSMNDMPDDPSWVSSSDLVFSNWPRDLPAPPVVHHVVHVFFERVPLVTKMFHKPNFLCKLQLPPSHMDFPSAILHGILAITAPYISVDALASRAYFPTGSSKSDVLHPERDFSTLSDSHQPSGMLSMNARVGGIGTPLSRFQMWHRRKCIERLSSHLSFGQGLLNATYAMAIISLMDYGNGWFVDVWMESMSGVRLATGLGLNNSSVQISDSLDRNTATLLPQCKTAVEQAERDRCWWMSYLVELLCCSGISYPVGLPEEEITVELPVTQAMYEAGGDGLLGVQTVHSPDFYSFNPPQHVDTLPLMVKALRLFTASQTFIRRYSRGEHLYQRYLSDSRLRQILADINAFRMSWPPHMRNAIRVMEDGAQTVDTELFMVIAFTHAAVVNLGEPLITRQTWANDAAKMVLSAIRANLSFIYDISSTSYDITLLPSFASFIWILSGRCLGRFINAARLVGDVVAAGVFESEYQVFENAIAQLTSRHPIARRHIKRMEFFRSSWIKHGESYIKTLAYDKTQVWDDEFENNQKATTDSTGSQASPGAGANISELHTPTHSSIPALSPAQSIPTMANNSQESLQKGLHHSAGPSPGGAASGARPLPMGTHPANVGGMPSQAISPQSVPIQTQMGGMPHLAAYPQRPPLGATVPPHHQPPPQPELHSQPQPQPPPQPPSRQVPIGVPPAVAAQGATQTGLPTEHAEIPNWLEGMDTFGINSYSFDVDSMLATLQSQNPNATFNGTTMFSLST